MGPPDVMSHPFWLKISPVAYSCCNCTSVFPTLTYTPPKQNVDHLRQNPRVGEGGRSGARCDAVVFQGKVLHI